MTDVSELLRLLRAGRFAPAQERLTVPTADLLDRCSFPPPGTAVTCAVSGGADSLALLVLAAEAGCDGDRVHVDHGLRAGVGRGGRRRRRGGGTGRRRLPAGSGWSSTAGPNLEARARRARYDALPADVLTGHTADDQAETVLLNLLRGAGLDGLAGYEPDPPAAAGAAAP